MTESAIDEGRRHRHRRRTATRITAAAQRLADQRGLDGFTLDDLAEAVDLSRRTLFNYFPGKLDAVLGAAPDLDTEVAAVFMAGGPTGDLVEDVISAACEVVSQDDFSREELETARRLLSSEPRLIALAHARFEQLGAELSGLVLRREGATLGPDRALLLVRVLVCAYDAALARVLAEPVGGVPDLAGALATTIRDIRALFA